MADNTQIIDLYTELADNPNKDFGWDKGLENAKAHDYKTKWINDLPSEVWKYCAAVGNPFSIGEIKEGLTILDLGCGAGVDVLVARLHVGDSGKVIGVDITPKMVEKAKAHAKLAGFTNVEILESNFDDISLDDDSVDIVISNGAINLTSCKESVFSEIYRVLKSDGKIYFADMIDISEPSSCSIEQSSCCTSDGEEDWANCVAGTIREDELLELIQKAGFKDVECTGHTHYTTADTTNGATFKATKIPADELREIHWENIFKTADYTQVLWHQSSPQKSLELIKNYSNLYASIIDVGCGASFLVDNLLDVGYKNITLLDTSKKSLDIVKNRLDSSSSLKYINSDILNFQTKNKFNIWHDRAVFHFLLNKKEQEKYFEVLTDSLMENSYAIISTFITDSQTECAGLEIVQYDYKKMLNELPESLKLVSSEEYIHITPKGSEQRYIYFVLSN